MRHGHDFVMAPMEIIRNKRRFLKNTVSRVYVYSPASIKFIGASIFSPHFGQMVS